MCGIVFAKDTGIMANITARRYQRQKHRGTQGFGYVSALNGEIIGLERSTEEKDILEKLHQDIGNMILFHHRFPTSTPNYVEATHPIFVSHESLKHDYLVVHNGVVSNAGILRTRHEAAGFKYRTLLTSYDVTVDGTQYIAGERFNDTEALAIELAITIEAIGTKLDITGTAAFIAYQIEKGKNRIEKVFFGRNTLNPLKVWGYKNFVTICSEGAGEDAEPHTLYCLDPITNDVTQRPLEIGFVFSATPSSNHLTGLNAAGKAWSEDEWADYYNQKDAERVSKQQTLLPVKTETPAIASETKKEKTNFEILCDLYEEEAYLDEQFLKWKGPKTHIHYVTCVSRYPQVKMEIARLEKLEYGIGEEGGDDTTTIKELKI